MKSIAYGLSSVYTAVSHGRSNWMKRLMQDHLPLKHAVWLIALVLLGASLGLAVRVSFNGGLAAQEAMRIDRVVYSRSDIQEMAARVKREALMRGSANVTAFEREGVRRIVTAYELDREAASIGINFTDVARWNVHNIAWNCCTLIRAKYIAYPSRERMETNDQMANLSYVEGQVTARGLNDVDPDMLKRRVDRAFPAYATAQQYFIVYTSSPAQTRQVLAGAGASEPRVMLERASRLKLDYQDFGILKLQEVPAEAQAAVRGAKGGDIVLVQGTGASVGKDQIVLVGQPSAAELAEFKKMDLPDKIGYDMYSEGQAANVKAWRVRTQHHADATSSYGWLYRKLRPKDLFTACRDLEHLTC